jgi:hypothetical protein
MPVGQHRPAPQQAASGLFSYVREYFNNGTRATINGVGDSPVIVDGRGRSGGC